MNIFLSYPRADAAIAYKLAADFERAGVDVWIWTKSVPDDLKKIREKRHELPKLPYHLYSLHYIVLDENMELIEAELLHAIAQLSEDDLWH